MTEDEYKKKIIELASPYGLADTIIAIARVESDMGKYMVNLQDPACGLTHIHLKTYMRRHNIKDTNFNRNKACSDLIKSVELAIANSIEELMFWKNQYCPKTLTQKCYRRMIRAYNTGYNNSSKKAYEYEAKVLKALKEEK